MLSIRLTDTYCFFNCFNCTRAYLDSIFHFDAEYTFRIFFYVETPKRIFVKFMTSYKSSKCYNRNKCIITSEKTVDLNKPKSSSSNNDNIGIGSLRFVEQ